MIFRIIFAFLLSFLSSAYAVTCEKNNSQEVTVAIYSSNNGNFDFAFIHNLKEKDVVHETKTTHGVVVYSFHEEENKVVILNVIQKTSNGKETKYQLVGKIMPEDPRCPEEHLRVHWEDNNYNRRFIMMK